MVIDGGEIEGGHLVRHKLLRMLSPEEIADARVKRTVHMAIFNNRSLHMLLKHIEAVDRVPYLWLVQSYAC